MTITRSSAVATPPRLTVPSFQSFRRSLDRLREGLAALLAGVACATPAMAGADGHFDVRAMRAPVVVAFEPPAADHLMLADDETPRALQERLAHALVAAAQRHPQRLITLEPATNQWRFDLLDEAMRGHLLEAHGHAAGAQFEEAMAAFLLGAIAMADAAQPGIPLSVIGIPAEPGGLTEAGAQQLNARFASVTSRLQALTSTRAFILSGPSPDEFQRVRLRLTEATRLNTGRPIIFRTNDQWRIAIPSESHAAERAPAVVLPQNVSGVSGAADHSAAGHAEGGGASFVWSASIEVDEQTPLTAQRARSRTTHSADAAARRNASGGATTALNGRRAEPAGEQQLAGPDDIDVFLPIRSRKDRLPRDCTDSSYDSWDNRHDFTFLPMTCDGWTDLSALFQRQDEIYGDARVIYVSSSSGEDSTGITYVLEHRDVGEDPLNPAYPELIRPFRTLQAAYGKLRDGFPDVLLLMRGDVWEESFTHSSAGNWRKGGRSPMERMILATYGSSTERPTLLLGSKDGLNVSGVQNLIVSGIRFYSHTWETGDRGKGVDILSGGTGARHQLHEDCVYERNDINRVQGSNDNRHESIAFRRSIFDRIDDQSIYATQTHHLLFEECLFHSSDPKRRRHLYLSPAGNEDSSTLRGVVLRENIFFDGRTTGLSIRSGGLIENNLIVRNDMMLVGGWGGSENSVQSAEIRDNVFLESSIGQGDGQRSIVLVNIDGGEVAGNIWTDDTNLGSSSYAIVFQGTDELQIARNISIRKNVVYGWAGEGSARALRYSGGFDVSNVSIMLNDFQMVNGSTEIIQHLGGDFTGFLYSGNRYYSTAPQGNWFAPGGSIAQWRVLSGEVGAQAVSVSYPYPTRNLRTYHQSIGGEASTDAFMAEALKQSRWTWRPQYGAARVNSYIREGFAVEPSGSAD